MSRISLFPFQTAASDNIVQRFDELDSDVNRPHETARWATPFYQALSALTGAGKTPILADAVTQIRATVADEPIVLWISKGKAVIEQTFANFQAGGKYSHFVEGFEKKYLSDLTAEEVHDGSTPLLVFTTVGTFNQKDKADGTLRVHKKSHDKTDDSLWGLLQKRSTSNDVRRPLVIVYDEGHNLSDQQTDLLLELEPDVILVASATMRTPGKLGRLIERLRDHGWSDEQLATTVNSREVVDAGLVKRQIILGGYATFMEAAIDDLIKGMSTVAAKADALNAGFSPKAIYVCRTNISQDDGTRDNHLRPFSERRAPPILIWRHLVEKKKVDPADIAVYCDLRFDRKHNPPPKDFVHFSGGEEDFGTFSAGNYRHIIFNQSLQEGWDDPECCFAYIDKSMGSSIQVEQVIGRVLRQPGARHFSDPDLNTAHFFIRIDDKQIFPEILDTVRRRIAAEIPEIRIDGYKDMREKERLREEPKEVRTIPEIHIELDPEPLTDAVANIIDYRRDKKNTVGRGERIRAVQRVGDNSKAGLKSEKTRHANRVMARWMVRRGIQALYPRTALAIDWSDGRFDAKIEVTSPAAVSLRKSAEQLVETYLEHCELTYEEENPYTVGPVLVDSSRIEKFDNALHAGYSDLSVSELPYARAIDALQLPWVRNPVASGFSIPLLEPGSTFNFFPDFIVWKNSTIYVLDPKGEHLVARDAGRKLLNIRDEQGKQKVKVRLFTPGKWKDTSTRVSRDGFTLWTMTNSGKVRCRHYSSIPEAVEAAVK